jgi:hypothetical protein
MRKFLQLNFERQTKAREIEKKKIKTGEGRIKRNILKKESKKNKNF